MQPERPSEPAAPSAGYRWQGRFRLVPAVYVLLIRDGLVLLSRRRNTGFEDGRLILPAGHLEGDEEIAAAAAREAREEVGIEIAPEDARVVGVMHRRTGEPGHERIDFFVLASRWRGEPRNLEPDRCAELAWCDPAALPSDVIPYVRWAIARSRAAGPEAVWFESWGWDSAPAGGD